MLKETAWLYVVISSPLTYHTNEKKCEAIRVDSNIEHKCLWLKKDVPRSIDNISHILYNIKIYGRLSRI